MISCSILNRLKWLVLTTAVLFVAGVPAALSLELPELSENARALLIEKDPALQVLPSVDSYFHRRGEQAPDAAMHAFQDRYGRQWDVFWDTRSDRPDLVSGQGIPFVPGAGNTLDTALYGQPGTVLTPDIMADTALRFIEHHPDLLRVDPASLEMDPVATRGFGENNRLWFVHFKQIHNNLEVKNARVFFRINSGNITQFGAHQIIDIPAAFNAKPSIAPEKALDIGIDHALTALTGDLEIVQPPELCIVPVFSEGRSGRVGEPYRGEPGKGYGARLVWELTFRLEPHIETWYAMIDAQSGEILHFQDDNKYGTIHGAVYFEDNIDPETDAPFPYAQTTQGIGTSGGRLDYPGGSVTCSLNGQYVQISDNCGSISLTSPDGDLGFGASPATNCSTPGYGGSGNTRATRTSFYHVNDVKMKARGYMPANTWLQAKLLTNVNINNTCNAFWNGTSINFYRDGSGCSNTGELAPVVLHEWGHGLDYNTGTTSNESASSEALADAMSFLQTRISCVGHNFRPGVPCNYGCDASCTGVRDPGVRPFVRPDNIHLDPASCARWSCPYSGYGGVMGYQGHCESLIASGAVWDTAVKMADAMGEAGWAHANRIFFETMDDYQAAYRIVSGGQCNPDADIDGCGSLNWYTVWIFADDDNGNLADGTPNGNLIWDAFNDHGIACGDQPAAYSECPPLSTPVLVTAPGENQVTLSWDPVSGASYYIIFRNTSGCEFERSVIGTTVSTQYVDNTVADDFTYYYSVQAVGANDACKSEMSACLDVSPGLSSNGTISMDKTLYGNNDTIIIVVGDLDLLGTGTLNVTVESDTEPAGETVTLSETGGSTGVFTGSILTTVTPGVSGQLTVSDGDEIRAVYVDDDIGDGTSETKTAIAYADLSPPVISNVAVSNITIDSFTVTWDTNEPADSVLTWGASTPPASVLSDSALTLAHEITVTGLDPCTLYYFKVQSSDSIGNTAEDDNAGQYYTATTYMLAILYEADMDTDPGWTYSADWAWGQPTGEGGQYGDPDPDSGYTGNNVVGYNLNGDYPNDMANTEWTTTPAFDCTGVTTVHLEFQCWLGVEQSIYDRAFIEVSNNNGGSWTTIWENSSTLNGGTWQLWEFDISALAAGYSQVRIRWGMGPTDYMWRYCGWNIDDVVVSSAVPCETVSDPVNCAATESDICEGESSILSAESAYTIHWFDDVCGGNEIGTGASLLVTPLVTTTYYARASDGATWSPGCCDITVTVHPLPDVTCPAGFDLCIDDDPVTLTGGSPAGGAYSGPGVSGGVFNPATAGEGTHVITYTYTDPYGCSDFCTFTITVHSLPDVTCPAGFDLCIDDDPVTLTGGSPAGGAYSGPGVSGGVFNPASAGEGTHVITYTYTDPYGCSDFCTFTITVHSLPDVTCPAGFDLCIDDDPVTLTGGSPAGGAYSGPGVSGGVFNPATAGEGAHVITYTYTDPYGCSDFCTFTITVHLLPDVTCPAGFDLCIDDDPVTLTGGSPAGGAYSGPGVSGGVFNPASAGEGAHVITYTYTDPYGCSDFCTFTVTVHPLPDVTCPAGFDLCIDDDPVTLTGGSPAGGAYSGPGVSGGVFNPASAGEGAHVITYTYTDPYGCSDFCTFTVTVHPLPDCTITAPATMFENSTAVISAPYSATATYAWTVTGATIIGPDDTFSIEIDSSPSSSGDTILVELEIEDSNGCTCTNSCTIDIVTPPPIPSTGMIGIGLLMLAMGGLIAVSRFRNTPGS